MSRAKGNVLLLLVGLATVLVSTRPALTQPAASETRREGASSGSLWTGGGDGDWFSDVKARRVGDLVTIRIVENTVAKQSAETDTSRESSGSVGIESLFGLQNYVPDELGLSSLIAASSTKEFRGGGANSRTNVLAATVTATVTEVLPGGNLVLEASRFVKVNGEEERLQLRGVVRSYDVGPTNVVLSTALAEVEILYGGKGVLGSNLKPGLLSRLIGILF